MIRHHASGSNPIAIAQGPDGNMWFTENGAGQIARITTDGSLTEYTDPACGHGPGPVGIAPGPDGNLWFADQNCFTDIGKISPSDGAIQQYPLGARNPLYIAAGPDSNLWFTESQEKIGRITTDGSISEFSTHIFNLPWGITAGPDNNLWFTEAYSNNIGQIRTTGTITLFTAVANRM